MNQTTAVALEKAYQLIRAGNLREARAILLPILRANQNIADAWYLLAHALTDPEKRLIAFQEVLRLEPANPSAKKQVAKLLAARAAVSKQKERKKQLGFGAMMGCMGLMGTTTFLLCLMMAGTAWWFSRNDIHTVAAATLIATAASSPTRQPEPTQTLVPLPSATLIAPTISAVIVKRAEEQVLSPITSTPAATASAQATVDVRLTPKYWREWPNVPTLSAKAKGILKAAAGNPALDFSTFSRVGDCQLTTGTFLGGYVTGKYPIPDGLGPTVAYFHNAIITESITASNGLGVNSVLNPIFAAGAGHNECGADETPLDCELRIRHPVIVVVAMGTNWVPHAEISFEKYLRMVVDRVLETGALPILATKADNVEQDWKLNLAIAQVAYDYDLPMVNVWRSVQDLPNHGLEAPKNIYLTGNAWSRRNHVWLQTLDETRLFFEKNPQK